MVSIQNIYKKKVKAQLDDCKNNAHKLAEKPNERSVEKLLTNFLENTFNLYHNNKASIASIG